MCIREAGRQEAERAAWAAPGVIRSSSRAALTVSAFGRVFRLRSCVRVGVWNREEEESERALQRRREGRARVQRADISRVGGGRRPSFSTGEATLS
jgi:hypothetical protein